METDHSKPEEPEEQPPRKRPLLLRFGVLLSVFVLCVIALFYFSSRNRSTGLQTVEMPDGSLLTLEKVTVGSHHELEVRIPQRFLFFRRRVRKIISTETEPDSTVVWFTRRDKTTGKALHFDWWSYSLVTDERGFEIEDESPGVKRYQAGWGSSSSGGQAGSRPFRMSGEKADVVVARSVIRPFRHQGETFKLRLYNVQNKLVAEFDVPNFNKRKLPDWKPEPLPVTKTDGDLSVTLKGLRFSDRTNPRSNRHKKSLTRAASTIEVRQRGKPTDDWSDREVTFSDAAGSRMGGWRIDLSPFETAWKLQVKLFRNELAKFDSSEQWTASGIRVPGKGAVAGLSRNHVIDKVRIELAAIGGAGKVTHTGLLTPKSPRENAELGAQASIGEKLSGYVEHKYKNGRAISVVEAAIPHLVGRVHGLTQKQKLYVQVTDDRGRPVPNFPTGQHDGLHYWFLDVPKGAKQLNVTFTVHRGRTVEFFVKPPEPKALSPDSQ